MNWQYHRKQACKALIFNSWQYKETLWHCCHIALHPKGGHHKEKLKFLKIKLPILRDSAPHRSKAEKLYLHLLFVVVPSRPASVTSPLYDVLGHTNHIFSESSWPEDIKTDITKCLRLKYTNTNTQIHKYSILQSARKTQHVVYF